MIKEDDFVELDFSQRPKDDVRKVHFSGRQFKLHCAFVEPTEMRFHYHLSLMQNMMEFLLIMFSVLSLRNMT